jgi:MFS family permease
MIESAVQRILVLIILYGTSFWNAVDQFLSKLTNQQGITNYTMMIAAGYILLHAVVGLLVGWFSANMATKSVKWPSNNYFIKETPEQNRSVNSQKSSSRKRLMKLSFFLIWVLLIIVYLQSISGIGDPILPAHVSLQILFRSLLIVLTWYFLISPIVLAMMKRWLEKQKENNHRDIHQVMLILPSVKNLVSKSWSISEGNSKLQRVKMFFKILLVNALHNKSA